MMSLEKPSLVRPKQLRNRRNRWLVEVTGFEPVAPSLRTKCSAWLSYTPAPEKQFTSPSFSLSGGSAPGHSPERRSGCLLTGR